MNGHFAAVGDGPTARQYEHGIQVIDEDKQYKFVITATLSATTSEPAREGCRRRARRRRDG